MSEPVLILASSSPRRRALLTQAGIAFRVVAPEVEECHRPNETPAEYVIRNAREKADWVCAREELGRVDAVLAADTVVVLDHHILEKPIDTADATSMLERLSGHVHCVLTGVGLYRVGVGEVVERSHFVESTSVRFRSLSENEIAQYVAGGEPMDKAGAYAIQGDGGGLVDGIDGSYANVVGLPVEHVVRVLQEWRRPTAP